MLLIIHEFSMAFLKKISVKVMNFSWYNNWNFKVILHEIGINFTMKYFLLFVPFMAMITPLIVRIMVISWYTVCQKFAFS